MGTAFGFTLHMLSAFLSSFTPQCTSLPFIQMILESYEPDAGISETEQYVSGLVKELHDRLHY